MTLNKTLAGSDITVTVMCSVGQVDRSRCINKQTCHHHYLKRKALICEKVKLVANLRGKLMIQDLIPYRQSKSALTIP